jgi:hypothetical protein
MGSGSSQTHVDLLADSVCLTHDVQHYDLSFAYDPATDRLDALNKITATATQNLSRFDLDLQQLTPSSGK